MPIGWLLCYYQKFCKVKTPSSGVFGGLKMELKVPLKKSRSGRFQISLFKDHRLVSPFRNCKDELSIARTRAFVQFFKYTESMQQVEWFSFWCSPEELRDLSNALDGLADLGEE